MSFSISNTKIEEALLAPSDETRSSQIDSGNLTPYYPSYGPGGITFAPPVLVTAAKKNHLLSLRRKIENAGIPLISGDELDAEMRDSRR